MRAYAQNSEVMVYQKDFNKWIDGFMMHAEFIPWEDEDTEFIVQYVWIENEGEDHTMDNPPVYSGDDMVEVMQYTGLKDKNAKKIYKGDIVSVDYHPFDLNGNYEVGYNDVMELSAGNLILHRIKNYCEVIGNIYENPELLEVNK